MELLYLWIEKYRNIENQGFNFSSKWSFDYQNEQLTVEEHTNSIDDFFGTDIINLTALVGANGSGKTNILEFLYENSLAHNFWNFKPHKNSHSIITYESPTNKDLFFFLVVKWFSKPLDLNKAGLVINKESFPEKFVLDSNEERDPTKDLPHEKINCAIYYSPFIRNKELYVEEGSFENTNISTGKLLKHTIRKEASPLFDRIDSYERSEFRSFIEILLAPIKKELPFNTDKINVALRFSPPTSSGDSKVAIEKIKTRLSEHSYFDDLAVLDFIVDRTFTPGGSISIVELKKLNLLNSLIFNTLHFFVANTPNKAFSNEPLSSNKEIYDKVQSFKKNKANINVYIDTMHDYITSVIDHKGVTSKNITTKSILNFFFELIENEVVTPLSFSISISLPLDKIKEAFIQERAYFFLLEKTFKNKFDLSFSYRHTEFLHPDIKNMSSGEKHYLQLFSRFRKLSHHIAKENTESLLILIDEGETSLHPQWQKQYIKLLKETLPLIFDKTPIQIILTSHSPFIISDLPKENIIFLKSEEGKTTVVDGIKQKETFGANIHTLFTDAFFIEGGLIGDLAKDKINKIIDYLNEKASPIKDDKEAQQYINIIGEPILKRQLQKMLDSHRLSEVDNVKKRILDLEDEMEGLKNQLTQLSHNSNDTSKS